MNMLSNGMAWLSSQLKAHASESVIYRRGSVSITVTAVRGSSAANETNQQGQQVRVFIRDFLIKAADLVIESVATKPVPGDQIELANGEIYEVMTDGADPGWRWSDPQHTTLRVHTQLYSNGY